MEDRERHPVPPGRFPEPPAPQPTDGLKNEGWAALRDSRTHRYVLSREGDEPRQPYARCSQLLYVY